MPASLPARLRCCWDKHMVTSLWFDIPREETAIRAGLRFGDAGAHTSRTMMLAELRELLAATDAAASREEYANAIIEDNVLGKQTASTRRITNQRLRELYGLDPKLPIFRVLRRLWDVDKDGQPILALLCALGRDPILRTTAPAVLGLGAGDELVRSSFVDSMRTALDERLNDAVLDKVARNTASSWTQSGHLTGRVRKVRRNVTPTPAATAFALWLGSQHGYAGEQLLHAPWPQVLDCTSTVLLEYIARAKQMRLLRASIGGGVVEIEASTLDPTLAQGRRQ